MDIIDILVLFVVFFNICIFVWLVDLLIAKPFMYLFFGDGNFGIVGETSYKVVTTVSSTFPSYTLPIYYLVTIFFLIMYIIFLIIMFIIPPTGFATLFIPVRELLLSIPPFPALINKGIFNFYGSLFKLFGFSGNSSLSEFTREYFYFSKDGSYEIMKLFNPHLNTDKIDAILQDINNNSENNNYDNYEFSIFEDMDNNNKKSELKTLRDNVNVCIDGSSDFTPPNIDYTGILKNNINAAKSNIKCNLSSITPYIQTEIND
jgi:hypothetical protein